MNDRPIKVQMKCSQVTRQVFCRFYFQNTADEDYYILHRNTPLEGKEMLYPYLTISQGHNVIEYVGIHMTRAPATKRSLTKIEAGKTITSPVVDVTSSYHFNNDGKYTIEYTKPFLYLPNMEVSMMDENTIIQGPSHDDLVASTVIYLTDTHNFKPTDAQMELAEQKFNRETSLQDEPVDITANCMKFSGNAKEKEVPKHAKVQRSTKQAHDLICGNRGFPKAYTDATTRTTNTPFTDFFRSSDKTTVANKLKTCRDIVQTSSRTMTYKFRGPSCSEPDHIAYSNKKNPDTIFLCELFEGYPTARYHWWTDRYTKFETIVHEMTHLWVDTKDYIDKGYGYEACKTLDKTVALTNADSYANYVQEVFYHNR